jgi:hypothetical protein
MSVESRDQDSCLDSVVYCFAQNRLLVTSEVDCNLCPVQNTCRCLKDMSEAPPACMHQRGTAAPIIQPTLPRTERPVRVLAPNTR